MVMTFFPDSASGEALSATADVTGFDFDRAAERLTDLSLLDVQQTDLISAPRYVLHPLVRAFAGAQLAEQPEFEQGARDRWVAWYAQLVEPIGDTWDNHQRLEPIDLEHENVYDAIQWTYKNSRYKDTIRISRGSSYFYFVRGKWDKKLPLEAMRAAAAQHLGDMDEELLALSYLSHRLMDQGRIDEAEQYLWRLDKLAQSPTISKDLLFEYKYTHALYKFARGDIISAEQIMRSCLAWSSHLTIHLRIINQQMLAACIHRKGDNEQAKRIYDDMLQLCITTGNQLGELHIQMELAIIDLDDGNIDSAESRLDHIFALSYIYKNRPHLAYLQCIRAYMCLVRNDREAARATLFDAADSLERLGMLFHLREVKNLHSQLSAESYLSPAEYKQRILHILPVWW
jgi:tetratricopeptide (TPR) repeat protein